MEQFKILFLGLLVVFSAAADEEAPEKDSKPILFSLASARAEGRELSEVELLADAYINLLDIMSKDDDAPTKYDEEDVLAQFAEYENPYVDDIIKVFRENKPKEEGKQGIDRLARLIDDHFTDKGYTAEEHQSVLDRHELFGKVTSRLIPPQKYHHQGQSAFGSPGHLGGEL